MTSKVTPPNDVGPKVEVDFWGETPMSAMLRAIAVHDIPRATFFLAVADALDELLSRPSAPRNISGDTEDDLGLPDLRVRGRAE